MKIRYRSCYKMIEMVENDSTLIHLPVSAFRGFKGMFDAAYSDNSPNIQLGRPDSLESFEWEV